MITSFLILNSRIYNNSRDVKYVIIFYKNRLIDSKHRRLKDINS